MNALSALDHESFANFLWHHRGMVWLAWLFFRQTNVNIVRPK